MAPQTTSRSKARRRAVEVLFEADLTGLRDGAQIAQLLEQRKQVTAAPSPLPEFAAVILAGVAEHYAQVEDVLETYQSGRAFSLLPPVDRCILRVGAWEMLFTDTDPNVVMDEAANLAALLSTEESPRVVNGLLGRLKDLAPTLRATM
ncbi:transcription antitermination factor NusB [Buchananella felis]|uniref:transcription antitermination factor NusB n=1 Tax=Buchananella felis TaxID=3231492 RepID=UPI003527B7C2